MAFEDVGVEVRDLAAANGVEEVGEMVLRFPMEGADQVAFVVEQQTARDDAFGSVEDAAAFIVGVERLGFEPAGFRYDGLVAEIEEADLRVGCLTGVCVA